MSKEDSGYTIILVPEDADRSRSFRLTPRLLRLFAVVGAGSTLAAAVLLGSWWYFASQAARIPELQGEIARLQEDNAKVEQLARALTQVQGEYEKVRQMLGADMLSDDRPPERLPAEGTARDDTRAPGTGLSPAIPTSWPLATAGFVTRIHRAEPSGEGRHPGLDIAVAQDSYIRASGAGEVVEAGSDSIYGLYVLIDHGDSGYRSMYGHASRLFVAPGDSVRQNEVIALSGNTGRSTAPHLHFEVLQDGKAVDPLTLVQQRSGS